MREIVDLLSFAAFLCLLWALLFGVTIDGSHWELKCTAGDGVHVVESVEVDDAVD